MSEDTPNDRSIHELSDRTVERIAAGEVVERPASAVKELIENSLDADASRVTVAVDGAGTERIRVRDDGIGMTETDAKRAVEQHTTSKIDDITDLEAGVRTLGFRGEALHAIGAVSRMTITTKPQGGTSGTEVIIEGGERTTVSPAGCPEGTTVDVTDLFYNVPARRKYLKQESTEFDHIQRIVTGYALAHPNVSMTLEHNGRERFSTSGRGDLRSTVMAVYGREVASAMIALDSDGADTERPAGPLTAISGLVSHPETNRASRAYCTTFINGRYVTARAVREAVVEAYGSQLASDRYPFAVINLQIAPEQLDVNVHPRKLEVRFAAEEEARNQVRHAVETALLEAGLIRSSAPRGRSAPEQTDIEPTQTAAETRDSPPTNTHDEHAPDDRTPIQSDQTATETDPADRSETTHAASNIDRSDRMDEHAPKSFDDQGDTAGAPLSTDSTGETPTDNGPTQTVPNEHDDESENPRRFRGATTQTRLHDDPEVAPDTDFDRLPALRVLGQIHETYIVAEIDDGLVLIDQHAADERINYERLRQEFAEDTTAQSLAEPVQLELTSREATLFEEYEDALAQLGFHASRIDDRIAEVRTVPGVLTDALTPDLIRDLLTAFVTGDGASTIEAAADELLADLACYPSVTGNTSLTDGSIVDLLSALDACENPYACPHGRPVIIELSQRELEERFERDYPGHENRRS